MRIPILLAALVIVAIPADAAPVSAPALTLARGSPVRAAQFDPYTKSVGTTPVHAFNADLDSDERGPDFLQELRITNRHASNGLCWRPVAYDEGCATDCAAATITCDGTATDGDFIAPGSWITLPISGLDCACVVGSAAATTTTSSRVRRLIAQRAPRRRRRARRGGRR